MFRWMVFLAVVGLAKPSALPQQLPHLDGRIVGGISTTIQAHPYQVSLEARGSHFCGGSLISSNVIVTAAHCLYRTFNLQAITVRLGSTKRGAGGVVMTIDSFKYHEDYDQATMENDIAVIWLSDHVNFTSAIAPIDLATSSPIDGAEAIVTGWGTLKQGGPTSKVLQEVSVNIVSEKMCASPSWGYGAMIKETMICAHGVNKDSCQGDSGGPLVVDRKLVGVVSWGLGCAKAGYPGVYADVASLNQWLIGTINYDK